MTPAQRFAFCGVLCLAATASGCNDSGSGGAASLPSLFPGATRLAFATEPVEVKQAGVFVEDGKLIIRMPTAVARVAKRLCKQPLRKDGKDVEGTNLFCDGVLHFAWESVQKRMEAWISKKLDSSLAAKDCKDAVEKIKSKDSFWKWLGWTAYEHTGLELMFKGMTVADWHEFLSSVCNVPVKVLQKNKKNAIDACRKWCAKPLAADDDKDMSSLGPLPSPTVAIAQLASSVLVPEAPTEDPAPTLDEEFYDLSLVQWLIGADDGAPIADDGDGSSDLSGFADLVIEGLEDAPLELDPPAVTVVVDDGLEEPAPAVPGGAPVLAPPISPTP